MEIRFACFEDYRAYSRLYLEINDLHAAAHPNLFRQTHLAPRDEEDFLIQLHDPEQAVFMAEIDGEAAGFVNVILREAPAIEILVPRRFAVVDSIGVARRFRRRGVGRALMERAAAWAVEKDAAGLELTVYEFNQNAIAFYQRLGYGSLSRKMHKPLE